MNAGCIQPAPEIWWRGVEVRCGQVTSTEASSSRKFGKEGEPVHRKQKNKINKWAYIKSKIICRNKKVIYGVKRWPIKWKKIFKNHISDKELISRVYKELVQLNNKKTQNTSVQKWAKDLSRCFSREEIQMANKHMKRWSASQSLRKCKSKPQWGITSHQLGPLAIITKQKVTNIDEDVENLELFMHC